VRIFLNYRRSDSAPRAYRLYDGLVARFGADRVFMDIDDIPPGVDFTQTVETALDDCAVVLALIGSNWLDTTDEIGRRRLDQPGDPVRRELEAALAREGVPVIPVLLEQTEMPAPGELPESLAPLARRNAVQLPDQHWRLALDALCADLEKIVPVDARDSTVRVGPVRRLVRHGPLLLAALSLIVAGFIAWRVERGSSDPQPTANTTPTKAQLTQAEVGRKLIKNWHDFTLSDPKCANTSCGPVGPLQFNVSCGVLRCAIQNGPGALWQGATVPLTQHGDRRFTATAHMATGKGLQCGGVAVDTEQLLDFSLVTSTPLQPGVHEPITGTLLMRPTHPDSRCGRVQPTISWKLSQPGP
jgi:hypothetical protein